MAERKMPMRRPIGMPKVKIPKGTFKRLMKYLFKYYKFQLILVMICLLGSGCAGAVASSFTQSIVDDIIIPGMQTGFNSVKHELFEAVAKMIFIYSIGVVCSLIYTQIMAVVTQGTLYRFRKDMFDKMESLPIGYFDTHQHGEIMSTYTNDTDTLRQLIGQSLPNILLSSISIIVIFSSDNFKVYFLSLLMYS